MIHIFHDWQISMTHDEVIKTCSICGKEKREPWYPITGWCRPPRLPPYPKQKVLDSITKGLNEAIEYEKNKKQHEYFGLYSEPYIEFHCVKILASTKEEARNKFKEYLSGKIYSSFNRDFMYVIPLFAIETIQ